MSSPHGKGHHEIPACSIRLTWDLYCFVDPHEGELVVKLTPVMVMATGMLLMASPVRAQSGPWVTRQLTTPGVTQPGNSNIAGTALSSRLGVGNLFPVYPVDIAGNAYYLVNAVNSTTANGSAAVRG